MFFAHLKQFALGSSLLLSAAAFLVVVSFIHLLLNRPKKLDLPIVGEPNEIDHRKTLIEGTSKVSNVKTQTSEFELVNTEFKTVPRQPVRNPNFTSPRHPPHLCHQRSKKSTRE
jgi:hypothetical protein